MQYSSLSLFSGMPSTQRKIRYELKIPPWSMKGWKNVQLWSWSYSNQNSRSGSVYLSVNPSLRSTAAACKWIFLRNQDFKMSAPKPSQFIQNLPQNQLLNLRQKSGQAMTRDWVIPMWFWSISSFPKSTKNPPGWALGGRSQFGSSGGNGWGVKSPLWTVLQKCGTKQQLLLFLSHFLNCRPGPISKGAWILNFASSVIPDFEGFYMEVVHPTQRFWRNRGEATELERCPKILHESRIPGHSQAPDHTTNPDHKYSTNWISLLPQAAQSQVFPTWEKLKPSTAQTEFHSFHS